MRQLLFTLFPALLLIGNACYAYDLAPDGPPPRPLYSTNDIFLRTATQDLKLRLEVARTQEQMNYGEMYRTSLPPKTGMIFLFGQPQAINMWMKNTLISLDMLFIDQHGTVINIVENTSPNSSDLISSGGAVTACIELAGGSAKRLGIARGDKVIHSPYFHD